MDVIPAIDLLNGQAVRLTKGRYEDVTVYSHDPAALAAEWKTLAKRLHVVDLEGAKAGHAVQRQLVQRVVAAFDGGVSRERTSDDAGKGGVQIGGGVRTFDAVKSYFDLGVARVVLGTAALRDPALVERAAAAYPGRIILAVDARNGYVATDGWLDQSETLAVDVVRRYEQADLAAVLYTDIDRDGTEVGPNVEATRSLAERTGVRVIASGGVGTLAHLTELGAAGSGIVGAIVGRALHERRFSLAQAIAAAAPG